MASRKMKGNPRQRGTEWILLVEDDDMVSALTKRILERSGYKVLTTVNGKEALELYEQEKVRISLVILDLIMPEMGGKKCLVELRNIAPNVKILVTSGHPIDGPTKDVIRSQASGFLSKPYNVTKILGTVRAVLDSD
jgi:DNA-binding response OmpR family regulator